MCVALVTQKHRYLYGELVMMLKILILFYISNIYCCV